MHFLSEKNYFMKLQCIMMAVIETNSQHVRRVAVLCSDILFMHICARITNLLGIIVQLH